MRFVVTGGGTGGHVFPCLEIAKEIKRQRPDAEVTIVGNKNSLEEKMAQRSNLPFFALSTKKIVGQSFANKLLALIFLKLSLIKAWWFLVKYRPSAVIGVGGYVSAPMVLASAMLRIKRYLCEQNVVPGLANQKLALIANRVFISFADSVKFFPSAKIILTGNPVRQDFFSSHRENKAVFDKLSILVTGGSLGARFLNHEVPLALRDIKQMNINLLVTHQTGKDQQEQVKQLYDQAGIQAIVTTFIDNMPQAFSEHDLLISRAGATVCAEIMAAGMPSILVPYPFANGHQQYNAEALQKNGAALLITEGIDFRARLAQSIKDLQSRDSLQTLGDKAKKMGTRDATVSIVNHVLNDC